MKSSISIFFFLSVFALSQRLSAQSFYAIDFIENKGQWKEDFQYKSTIGDGSVFIQRKGYTILKNNPADYNSVLEYMHGHQDDVKSPVKTSADMQEGQPEKGRKEPPILNSHAYSVVFKGSSEKANFQNEKFTGETANYFLGDDPVRWQKNVKSFGSVLQKDLYAGIDIRYYSSGNKMKYDLTVRPGADPSRIVMQYDGVDKLSIKDGHLVITTSVGDTKELPPYAFQIIGGIKKEVECYYEIKGKTVQFKVKSYDKTAALVIDPICQGCTKLKVCRTGCYIKSLIQTGNPFS
jgi:radical SAM protein with 4Fe4S-binding SPASM domain